MEGLICWHLLLGEGEAGGRQPAVRLGEGRERGSDLGGGG